MPQTEHFDLNAFLASIQSAFIGLLAHVCFDAGIHGLAFAVLILISGLVLGARKSKFSRPLVSVSKKLAIFCAILCIPGVIALIGSGSLPSTGNLHVSTLGFIAFWSLICLHLSAEEMNFQWF
jgi:DMSO/TMAO reductase YedYZ heme-binding membrane subunit